MTLENFNFGKRHSTFFMGENEIYVTREQSEYLHEMLDDKMVSQFFFNPISVGVGNVVFLLYRPQD